MNIKGQGHLLTFVQGHSDSTFSNVFFSKNTKLIEAIFQVELYAFVWEKVKTMDFSEIIVVYDIKVGRCSQLNEYMKLYEYQRSKSFIDLGPNHSDSILLIFFSSVTTDFKMKI